MPTFTELMIWHNSQGFVREVEGHEPKWVRYSDEAHRGLWNIEMYETADMGIITKYADVVGEYDGWPVYVSKWIMDYPHKFRIMF